MSEPCLSLVILTEDSGKNARATVEALVRKMIGLVVPGCRVYDRIAFLPREPREEEAMRGNAWKAAGKNKNPVAHAQRVRLLRYIARRLCQADLRSVPHRRGPAVGRAAHERERGELRATRTRRGRGAEAEPEGPRLRIENLLLLCPFRSIEAWLYQNLQRAVEICRRHHGGRHAGDLAAWEHERARFDELNRPEDALCLKKARNLELASHGFPAEVARAVGKSFAESVARMEACAPLRVALERTLAAEPE